MRIKICMFYTFIYKWWILVSANLFPTFFQTTKWFGKIYFLSYRQPAVSILFLYRMKLNL